eukprot:5399680-Heterocapsa_arctica.AAC.1
MEECGDNKSAPGLQWHQERQTMTVNHIEITKVGGLSLTHRRAKQTSQVRIEDENRNLMQGCRAGGDRPG